MLKLVKSFVGKTPRDRAQQINEHLLFEMPTVTTDCALLLGARSASGEIALRAADIYKKGQVKKLVLSGGLPARQLSTVFAASIDKHISVPMNAFSENRNEAEWMRDILLENGVNKNDILLVDTQSKNTGENLENCKAILDVIGSITIVCLAYHQRRALGTLRKTLSTRPVVTTSAVYPFGITKDNWQQTKLAFILEDEMDKITIDKPGNYISKGFCSAVDLEQETQFVKNLLRASKRPGPAPY